MNSEEITALSEIKWAKDIPHYMLVGNHEMGINDLSKSSAHVFKELGFDVVDKPFIDTYYDRPGGEWDVELAFLPYVLESDRKDIHEYFPNPVTRPRFLFSHNDIQGVQMGKIVSKVGFTKEEIEDVCTYCFNGHLHNGVDVSKKIKNVGNITGQNFGEDATQYPHNAYILDTHDYLGQWSYKYYNNTEAFAFYKLDFTQGNYNDFHFTGYRNNICSVKCYNHQVEQVRRWLADHNVVESRIVIAQEIVNVDSINDVEDFSIDHIQKFNEFVLSTMENTEVLLQELAEVSK